MINKDALQTYRTLNVKTQEHTLSSVNTFKQPTSLKDFTDCKCNEVFVKTTEVQKSFRSGSASRKKLITPTYHALKEKPIRSSPYLGYTSVSNLDKWTRM